MLGCHDARPLCSGVTLACEKNVVCGRVDAGGRFLPARGEKTSVPCGFHFFSGEGLRFFKRLFHRLLSGIDCRELLAHLRGDACEFRDRANWMPTYGTGLTVGLFGSADRIESSVILANGTFWYSGLSYRDVRAPGGTLAQPSFSATNSM